MKNKIGIMLLCLLSVFFFLACSMLEMLREALAYYEYPDSRAVKPLNHTYRRIRDVKRPKNEMSGINLGCALDFPPGTDWVANIRMEDLDVVQNAGFHYIRLPVQFSTRVIDNRTGEIDPSFLKKVDTIIDNIIARGMIVILDLQNFPSTFFPYTPFKSDEEKARLENTFVAIWSFLAEHYKNYSADLYFDLMNEPYRPITPEVWNDFVKAAIDVIRASGGNNTKRMIVVEVGISLGDPTPYWDHISGIDVLELPPVEEDPNIMVSFHYYSPIAFTYQGESYTEELRAISGYWLENTWSGTQAQMDNLKRDFDRMEQWGKKHRRRIFLGEFGVTPHADVESTVTWVAAVRKEAEKRNMIWAHWTLYENSSKLGSIYDQESKTWKKEYIDVLMPPR